MSELNKEQILKLLQNTAKALEKNNMQTFIVSSKEEALQKHYEWKGKLETKSRTKAL